MTYSAAGTETTTPRDPRTTNRFSDAATGTSSVGSTTPFNTGYNTNSPLKSSLPVSITVTGRWVYGTGQDDANDPAPPSVMVIEAVMLDQAGHNSDGSLATGTFDDAFGDGTHIVTLYGKPDQVCSTPGGIPLAHQTTESGSTFTITLTFTAGPQAAGQPWQNMDANVGFDSYSATIHAQPYGWYDVGWTDSNGTHHAGPLINSANGSMMFEYGWKSTDGSLGDLKGITMYEYLSYSGPGKFSADNTTFYPSLPAQPGYSVFGSGPR